MYDTTIATKLTDQLKRFLGRISPHFRKPVARFMGDMMYGIMKEKDVKLSSIVRALKEETSKKREGGCTMFDNVELARPNCQPAAFGP